MTEQTTETPGPEDRQGIRKELSGLLIAQAQDQRAIDETRAFMKIRAKAIASLLDELAELDEKAWASGERQSLAPVLLRLVLRMDSQRKTVSGAMLASNEPAHRQPVASGRAPVGYPRTGSIRRDCSRVSAACMTIVRISRLRSCFSSHADDRAPGLGCASIRHQAEPGPQQPGSPV
jgi:hypothetical protein